MDDQNAKKTVKIFDLLEDTDVLGIITLDGDLHSFLTKSYRIVRNNADTINELMIAILKEPIHRRGYWLWKFRKGRPFAYVVGLPFEMTS